MAYIEVKNLSFSYPASQNKALDNVSFSAHKGEIVLLIGKTGSGKSTLLKLMKKEIAPFGNISGNINIESENTGFVFQNVDESIVSDSVVGELSFPLSCRNMNKNEISLKLAEVTSFFNLSSYLDCDTMSLSGGTKQLLSLASAMICGSDIIFLDEPTSQLDPASKERFFTVLKRLNDELGITIIMATHEPSDFISSADKILLIDNGKMLSCGNPLEVFDYMKKEENEMINSFPISLLMFEEMTVNGAKKKAFNLKEKELLPLANDEKSVKIKDIYFSYSKRGADVLSALSFTAYKGKINSIIGANAGGKTTLLKIIAGVYKQYYGKVKLSGKTSMMSQNAYLLFTKDRLCDELSEKMLDRLSLSHLREKNPLDLSGGEARLAALGMVIQTNADIIILDEPTQALDITLKNKLETILKELCNQGKTVILASHDLEFVGRVSDYVSFLSDKSICAFDERRRFFSSLSLYTTDIRRITKDILPYAVSREDIL